jgi:hypothetical protein
MEEEARCVWMWCPLEASNKEKKYQCLFCPFLHFGPLEVSDSDCCISCEAASAKAAAAEAHICADVCHAGAGEQPAGRQRWKDDGRAASVEKKERKVQ